MIEKENETQSSFLLFLLSVSSLSLSLKYKSSPLDKRNYKRKRVLIHLLIPAFKRRKRNNYAGNLGDEIIRLWIVSQHWRLDS